MTENEIQNQILHYLSIQKDLFFYRSNNIPRYDTKRKIFFSLPKFTPKGIPDIHVVKNGRYIAIEVKKPGSYLSPDQKVFKANVERCGGIYLLARSIDDLIGVI